MIKTRKCKCYRMIALRGLLIGVALHVCSTVTLAQVGPEFGFFVDRFYFTAQVGVAYGPSEFAADFAVYQPYTYLINSLPDTVRAADGEIEAEIEFDSSGQQTGLPPGITFSLDGYGRPVLSGTPTATGTFKFVVIARNAEWGCNCGVGNSVGYVTFTITVSAPAITFTGVPDTLTAGTYGSAYPSVTFAATSGTPSYNYTASGLPPGMSINASTGVLSGTPASAGTFPFTVAASDQTTGSGAPYSGDSVFYLTINPAPLTITANDTSKTYGAAMPTLTASYIGFVGTDNASSLTTKPTFNTAATATSPVGSYGITVGGAVDSNYTITYGQPGTLTVTPAPLTITANNDSMTYGGPVPALPSTAVSYSGFVGSDNASSLTTAPTLSTTATVSSPVGSYPITAGSAADSNYSIAYVSGTLTIDPVTLSVTADSASRVYGTPDPKFNYTVTGLVNGDDTTIFTGSLSRDTGENVGAYAITQGTLSAGGNYVMNFTGNILTITQALQTITWLQALLSGCDTTTQLQLTATASSGLPVTYTTSDPGVATVAGDELTLLQSGTAIIIATQPGDENHFAAPPIADTLVDQSPSLVRQHWSDVLFFDNSSDQYVGWQWYNNGTAIPGATGQYYSATSGLNGQYYVIATKNTGQTIQTCPLSITSGSGTVAGGIQVFPNPVRLAGSVTVVSNYSAAALQGALMLIVDMSGKVWQQLTTVQPSMQVTMPAAGGIYTISLQLSNGQKATVNVLVNE